MRRNHGTGLLIRLDFNDIIVRNADGDLISLSFDYRGHLRFG